MRFVLALLLLALPLAAAAQTAPGSPFWMSGAPASDAGDVACNQMPALTGDVTTVAGNCATTVALIQGKTVSGTTGTVNVVFSNAPTLTGTLTAAAITVSGSMSVGTASTDFLLLSGSATAPSITTSGGDIAINSNSGSVQFANASMFSANGSVLTVLGGIGPVGSHTTVQTWFTIKDSGGAVRYIPAF